MWACVGLAMFFLVCIQLYLSNCFIPESKLPPLPNPPLQGEGKGKTLLAGRGSLEAHPRFGDGFWEGSAPSTIDQQYLSNRCYTNKVRVGALLSDFPYFTSLIVQKSVAKSGFKTNA